MREISGNLSDHFGKRIVVITTNGKINHDHTAVMGNVCSKEAASRFPEIPARLGRLLAEKGNRVQELGNGVVSFPIEQSPWEMSGIAQIQRSALELKALADRNGWTEVVLPSPACGGGGLTVTEIRPVLESILDDRFWLIMTD